MEPVWDMYHPQRSFQEKVQTTRVVQMEVIWEVYNQKLRYQEQVQTNNIPNNQTCIRDCCSSSWYIPPDPQQQRYSPDYQRTPIYSPVGVKSNPKPKTWKWNTTGLAGDKLFMQSKKRKQIIHKGTKKENKTKKRKLQNEGNSPSTNFETVLKWFVNPQPCATHQLCVERTYETVDDLVKGKCIKNVHYGQ
eukprot:TRINITY_DN20287_c0_g1_i2.p1 TRINITY_DN20287_c0_g1~~TRINITY_DN20287_c0_g1_i2.p1  ORF type:complete len:191 (-),score=20.92 TRINITY_DN20287_c0_g1_i2:35-607(-)